MARLLIIEDDGDLQKVLSFSFNREGFETHYAFNGEEGYEKIVSLQPDLILLDLILPFLSGVELLKRVNDNAMLREIPVVVMTGHGDEPGMLESDIRAKGARGYVRKPFDIKSLIGMVRRLIADHPRRTISCLSKGAVRLDPRLRLVWIHGRLTASLSPRRAAVLRVLLEAPGAVPRNLIMKKVWGSSLHEAALEKTIQRLREDLGSQEDGHRLQTTANGYELVG